MRKMIVLVAVFLFAFSAASFGMINIPWLASGGFYQNDASTPLLNNIGDTALIQLLSAGANGTIDSPTTSGNFVGGDDQLLVQLVFTNQNGGSFEPFATSGANYGTYTNAYSSFNVYGRIFLGTTPTNGTWYYDGPTAATINEPDQSNTQLYDLNRNLVGGEGDAVNQQVVGAVPEPATLGFLGVGVGLLLFRRFRK